MAHPSLLSLKDVSVCYRPFRQEPVVPLSNLSLEVARGEFIVVVGDSGAGKSTLLHFVAGFLRPPRKVSFLGSRCERLLRGHRFIRTEGRIWIDGEEVTDFEPWRRNIGLVMQRFSLYPHMSVRRNLEFPLRLRGVPRELRRARVLDVAERLNIQALLTKAPAEISGGEQQRVAIGKMLLRDPCVALMDEPFSHLDWRLRRSLRQQVIENFLLDASRPRCMLFVTHDLEDAREADRIILLAKSETGTRISIFPENKGCESGAAWHEFQSAVGTRE